MFKMSNCLYCGEVLVISRNHVHKLFCGESCRMKYHKIRERERKNAKQLSMAVDL
jgi:hypothetical protein